MKTTRIFALAAMAMIAFACTKENQETEPVNPENPNIIVFTAEAPCKTATANDQTVTWVAGDEVKFVWDGGNATAAASASGASTSFSVTIPDGVTELYAVYPAAAGGTYDSGSVTVHFNGSRTDGSFAANDICVSKAVKTGDEWSTALAFKNAACILKVGVSGSEVTRLQISAVGGELISGAFAVSIDGNGEPVIGGAIGEAGSTVNMTVSGPGDYYIPVKPGVTLSDGFRINIYKGDDQGIPFFYNGSFTTERGKIIKLSDIEAHAGQYYVTPSGAGTKAGQSWTNAMDAAQFKSFIENQDNYFLLNGATFHLSAEAFTFGDYLQPSFSDHSEVAFTIEGTKSGSDTTTFIGGTGDPAGTLWPQTNSNVTVKNVKFTGTDGDSNRAAIRVNNTGVKLQLEDCIFENNKTSGQSGAINLIKGIVSITGCEFTGNSASSSGASVRVENATVTISGCIFTGNKGDGNALVCAGTGAVVTMEDCEITGGNKCTVYSTNANTVSFTRVNFHDNHAVSDGGGAAWLEGAGTYTFTDCDFVNNAADTRGGAVAIMSSGVHASFTGGKFQGNHTDTAGNNGNYSGGAIVASGGTTFECTNVLFKDNYSYVGSNLNAGGIIRLNSSGDCARFNACVFDGNWCARSSESTNACAAIINCRNDGTSFYFNACEFKENTSGTGEADQIGGLQGTVIASYASSTIAMNNCSMHNNYGARNNNNLSWIYVSNSSNNLIVSNSTIVGDPTRVGGTMQNDWGVVKLGTTGNYYFINNILCSEQNGKDSQAIWCDTNNTAVLSYYNKTTKDVDGKIRWGTDTGSGHDYTANSSCFGSWSAPYTWNGTLTGTNSNMKAATADVNTEIQNADADFHAWLNSIGALGKNINGKSRGATSWPGCYQN